MKLRTLKAQFAAEFIDIEKAAGLAEVSWEPHQIQFLNIVSRLSADSKARQIAWSFTAALDAVTSGILNDDTPHIFVSINLDEAKEKIRYCKAIVDATDPRVRPNVTQESTTSVEFGNKSRCISHPCRPPRGKGRARIYLDEMAHYKEGLDREIYRAALPATVKGDGYIRIGSSPLGAKGFFWEVMTESMRRFPGCVRRYIPWWTVNALCNDVKAAATVAPKMHTGERVRQFGTLALVEIFENMFLEDFQQEYECAWVDELTAWITWEIIKRNQAAHDGVWWHAKSVDQALHMLPLVQRAIYDGAIEPVFVGGIDVGRKKDLTEFMILGRQRGGALPIRFSISLDRVKFDDQQSCFWQIITQLPFTAVLVDRTGLGMQLAEGLERTGKAAGVDFTNEMKELIAVESRIQAERSKTPLPMDRDVAYQIHSIKKTTTPGKLSRFDTEKNLKHHADKFWAWALGVYAAAAVKMAQGSRDEIVRLPWARIG